MNKKNIFSFLTTLFILANFSFLPSPAEAREGKDFVHLLYFYSESCHVCQKVRQEIIPGIEKEFFDRVIIEYLDIADVTNYKLMLYLKDKYKNNDAGVPAILAGERILVGYQDIKEGLRNSILNAIKEKKFEEINKLTGFDLAKHFLSFGTLAIILAGLLDGINPCAFTVIVFFISFLALQGYRKKELAIIGISFILAVFLTYVLIGLGIFRFLYSLDKFYLLSKITYYSIAGLCFILASLAIYDLILFKRTGKTEGMALQLPKIIKNRIHSIIGFYYRKDKSDRVEEVPAQKHFFRLIISAFFTGFLVSLLEAVCTGQLYLPTIGFVLKETSLRVRALGYLLLYNLMFIIPLILVLILALFGATSETFARFMKERMLFVKLLMAIIFLGLGVIILLGA